MPVLILLAGFGFKAHAADLLEVYRLAQTNDPTFEVARYTLKAAQEKHPQALAGLLPTISLNGVNNVTHAETSFSNASPVNRNVNAWNWTLQLTQPLIRVQNFYAYSEAERIVERAQAQFISAEQDLILRVAQAYFGVLSSQEGIRVGEAELSVAIEQLNLTTKGYERGIASIAEVRDSQARVDLARSHLVAAQGELDVKNAELGKIVNDVPLNLAPLKPSATLSPPQPANPRVWIEQAKESNPVVHAAQSAMLAAESRIGKSRAEHAPTLDFIASYGENFSSGNTSVPTDYETKGKSSLTGLQFNLPLFSGGGINSRVKEAIANKDTALAEMEVAKRQAATEARLAFVGVMNGLSQIAALESAVKSSQIAVDANRSGTRLGIYSNINVLNAEQQLYTAMRDLVKARYDTLFQALKLKATAGILNEAELINANALLEH